MPNLEFPPGMPDELREFVTNKITRQEMEVDAYRHEISRFFDELMPEQLRTLCALFGMMDKKSALYYQGYVTALLQAKFNLCAGCGQDHDKILLDEVNTIQDGPAPDILVSGIDSEANRIDTCSTCHGDKIIKVCEHPNGSHGQMTREACPEPTEVPCCECCCPEWYPVEKPLSFHAGCSGAFLPLPEDNLFVCSGCGVRLQQ